MKLAILTGDLGAAAATLSPEQIDQALQALRDSARTICEWDGHDPRFTRFRGDGWQICLARPQHALRAALVMRATVKSLGKGFETRIGLAVGRGTLPKHGDLNQASGPVFAASGRALDRLTDQTAKAPGMAHTRGGAIGGATRLADHISRGWSPAQARAMALMLHQHAPTHAEAAAQIGVTRQAVDQALRAAGYPALSEALAQIEGTQD